MNYSIKIFIEFDIELESMWNSFHEKNGWSPFQTFIWLSHWQNFVGDRYYNISPQIVVVESQSEIIAILPLGIRKFKGLNILEWLGGIHCDYKGPILSNKFDILIESFADFWLKVQSQINSFDVILLTRQPKNLKECMNPFVNALENRFGISAYSSTLESDWENFYSKRIKKKRQGDSRRQLKRLSEMGDLFFDPDYIL